MGVSVLLPEKFNICRSRVPLLSHKSFNISASLAFADILVGIVVVPFSLTQVGLSKVQFKRISYFSFSSKYWDSGSLVTTGARYDVFLLQYIYRLSQKKRVK